jgi:hypothetical protein
MKNEKSMLSEAPNRLVQDKAKSPEREENTAQTQNPAIEQTNPVKPIEAEKPPFMPHKTLMLIGILALITIILLGIAFHLGFPNTNKPGAQQIKVLQTTLSVLEPVASSSAYTTNLTLTTERKKVTAVQIELTYDPKVLTNVDIKPGPFFPSPTILLKKIDKVKGRISYALGIGLGQKAVNGNGTVAVLSFTPLLKSGITIIAFLKTSEVTVVGEIPSILTAAHGIQFPFGLTPTP